MIKLLVEDGFNELETVSAIEALNKMGLDVKTVGVGTKIPKGARGLQITCDLMLDGMADSAKKAPQAQNASASASKLSELPPELQEEVSKNIKSVLNACENFSVKVSVKKVDCNSRLMRLQLSPAADVKIGIFAHLADDIMGELAMSGIRMEAPIPGLSTIGFEIPLKNPSPVKFGSIIAEEDCPSSTAAPIGKDITGDTVFCDIAKMPHLMIGGAAGMGKSVCINSILASLILKSSPEELGLILIDPKKVEFNSYNGLPHLLAPVITNTEKALGALSWVYNEMERRYDLLSDLSTRNIDEYNKKVNENPSVGKPLPRIIVVIDELDDIMIDSHDTAEELISSITQMSRAAGIHLIISTQRASSDVISGVIKANIPSRIAFKVTRGIESRTLIDTSGAEGLLANGDMLYHPAGAVKAIRVQGTYISDDEILKVIDGAKEKYAPRENGDDILCQIAAEAEKLRNSSESDEAYDMLDDDLFVYAAELAIAQGKISTSLIQRNLSVGYGKAAKFIDCMEDLGIVSGPQGQKPRDTVMSLDEFKKLLEKRNSK